MKNRTNLEIKLRDLFKVIEHNKAIYENMLKSVMGRIPIRKFAEYFSGGEVLMNDQEIYWLAKAFLKEYRSLPVEDKVDLKPFEFKLEKFYTVNEINVAELYTIEIENEIEDTLVIDNVMKISNDEYVCYNMSYKDISKAIDNGLITYNYETQRNPIVSYSEITDDVFYRPRIHAKTVSEIFDDMVSGEFIPNMLTWNILRTGMEDFEYDGRKRQLVFRKDSGSQINIIDGYHRILAIRMAIEKNPEFDGHMQIKIFNFDVDRAKKFIKQEAKGSTNHIVRSNKPKESMYDRFVEQLNEYGNLTSNRMYHKIEMNKENDLNKNSTYVYKHTLADAIEINYGEILGDNTKYQETFEWIVKFLNEVIRIKTTNFNQNKENKRKMVDTRNNIFTLYITWSKILLGDKNWKKKLTKNVQAIDWTLDNPIWENSMIMSGRDDKRIAKKIISLAESLYSTM